MLPNLRSFRCSGLSAQSLSHIGRWTTLRQLHLYAIAGGSSSELAQIDELHDLRELLVWWNLLTDSEALFLMGLARLEKLDLSFASVTGPGLVILASFPNLKRLADLVAARPAMQRTIQKNAA